MRFSVENLVLVVALQGLQRKPMELLRVVRVRCPFEDSPMKRHVQFFGLNYKALNLVCPCRPARHLCLHIVAKGKKEISELSDIRNRKPFRG